MDKQNNLLNDKAFETAVRKAFVAKPLGERVVKLVKQHAAGRSQATTSPSCHLAGCPPERARASSFLHPTKGGL